MMSPKLRRVFALAALISALSLLPAKAAGIASREPKRVSFSERIESWGISAWSFLAGFIAKSGSRWDPSGARGGISASSEDGGH